MHNIYPDDTGMQTCIDLSFEAHMKTSNVLACHVWKRSGDNFSSRVSLSAQHTVVLELCD